MIRPGRFASLLAVALLLVPALGLAQSQATTGVIEGTHPDSDLLLRGRMAAQAPEIDGQVIVNDGEAEPGSFVTCEVTEAHPYDLVGRIVRP